MHPPPDTESWHAWRRSVDDRMEEGSQRFKRIEEKADERFKKASERHREIIGSIDGLRAILKAEGRERHLSRYGDDHDEDEISASTTIEDVKRKARQLRMQKRHSAKMNKWGKFVAPFLLGIGAVIWETLKRTVLK